MNVWRFVALFSAVVCFFLSAFDTNLMAAGGWLMTVAYAFVDLLASKEEA